MESGIENPFKGLRSYEQKDSGKLFGREKDLVLMKDRIFSSRTTLLFAGSGVGKTSFLNAKVIPALSRSFFVFYYNEWASKGEPLAAVKKALCEQLNLNKDEASKSLCSILGVLRESDASGQTGEEAANRCLLILDQFEEIFQYHSYEAYFRDFINEICEVINAEGLQSRIIFSMREEFLGELSVFDNRVPGLFNNYYRLKYPDKQEAEDIIVNTSGLVGVEVDEKNLSELVGDLSKIEKGAAGFAERASGDGGARMRVIERDFVVPPYLQIACHGLWEKQLSRAQNGDDIAAHFLSDYKPNEAHGVLKEFCNKKLSSLTFGEQFVAARAFNFLVTKQGAKMAYELTRLSEHMIVSKKKLRRTLEKLSRPDTRILRESRGPDGSRWFELYHDMYGMIVDDWKHKVTARMRNLGLIGVAVFFVFLFFLITYFLPNWYYNPRDYIKTLETETVKYEDAENAYKNLHETFGYAKRANTLWARYWERRAIQEELQQNRDKALLCWIKSLEAEPDGEAASKRRIEAGRLAGEDYQSVIATFRYSKRLSSPFISADGSAVVTQDADEKVSLWNPYTGDPIIQQLSLDKTPKEPTKGRSDIFQAGASFAAPKAAVRYDRYKFLIAGTGASDNLFIWRADTGKKIAELNIGKGIDEFSLSSVNLAFSPDGKYLAVGGANHKPQVWRVSDTGATLEKRITQNNGAKDFAFSSDSSRLITTDGKGVRLWNLESPSQRVKVVSLTKEALTVAFSPDGKIFLVGSDDRSMQARLTESAQPIGMVIQPYPPDYTSSLPSYELAIGPDGKTGFVIESDVKIVSWDIQTGKSITRHRQGIFHPDAGHILTGDGRDLSRMIRIDDRTPDTGIIKFEDSIQRLDLSLDGKLITTLTSSARLHVWSADTLEPIGGPLDLSESVTKSAAEPVYTRIPSLGFFSNGEFVTRITENFVIKTWQVSKRERILDKQLPVLEVLEIFARRAIFGNPYGQTVFSPDGKYVILTDGYRRIVLLDTYTVTPILTSTLTRPTFAFSPDSNFFIFQDYSDSARVFDLSKKSEIPLNKADMPAERISLFAFGGDRLITGSNNTTQIWDLTTGNVISRIKERKGNTISSIAVSPDLKWVLTGSSTGVVSLWDITERDAKQIGSSVDLNSPISEIKLSDDGTAFIAFVGSWAYLFSIESGGIRHRATRLLTNEYTKRSIIWDGASPTIRQVSNLTPTIVKVDNYDFSERGIVPLDGAPSALWEQWESKCALTLNKNGEFVPLYQSDNDSVKDKDSDR